MSFAGKGFPVRTKGTGNTEHMFSQWGLVGTGNREQGTGNRGHAVFRENPSLEFCPFHEITGFTLTLLSRLLRS